MRLKIDMYDSAKIATAYDRIRPLGNGPAMKILNMVCMEPGITPKQIYHKLRIEQSIASFHLREMREAGIVTGDKDGKFVHYYPNVELMRKVIIGINKFCMNGKNN